MIQVNLIFQIYPHKLHVLQNLTTGIFAHLRAGSNLETTIDMVASLVCQYMSMQFINVVNLTTLFRLYLFPQSFLYKHFILLVFTFDLFMNRCRSDMCSRLCIYESVDLFILYTT